MKKLKLFLLFILICGCLPSIGSEVVYKTALFGSSYNSKSVSSYTDTWTATNNGFTVSLANFNNNNNGWDYVKCGRRDYTSVGTITTSAAIDQAITKVVVTVDAVNTNKVNSFKLYVASNPAFTSNLQTIPITIQQGANTFTVSTPASNSYYKIEADCQSNSSNGIVTISRIDYYYNNSVTTVTSPTISGTTPFDESSSVSISAANGCSIYYTTNGSTPTTSSTSYSTPFNITATTTVKAIAVDGNNNKSDVTTQTFYKRPAAPTISGTNNFESSSTITITATSGTIYYTTDGSTPTSSSTEYTAPFDIVTTTTVKAIVIDANNVSSNVTSTTFTCTSSTASFIFNTDAGLAALGIAKPSSGAGTSLGTSSYTSGSVTLTATSGSTATRVWNSSGTLDLRIYNNGSITLSVPEGNHLNGITFTSNGSLSLTSSTGTLSNKIWTPANSTTTSVTFTASATVNINTIEVSNEADYSSVSSFSEMKALDSGSLVFLRLAESNAGVIEYVDPVANAGTTSAQNAYVRDGSGAMKFSNVLPTSRAWHTRASGALIGNILGRYTVVNGMPTFTSVEGSTAHRMLCLEGYQAITPSNVSVSDLTGATYRADYVGLSEVTLTKANDTYYVTDGNNNVLVDNAFSAVTFPETVANKRFDITGIVETTSGGDSKLSLTSLTEVFASLTLNENYSNSTVIANHDNETVKIHLTRALTPNTWNTISLPISINEVSDVLGADVQIAAYTGFNSSSNVMEFTTVNEIEAGKPYLIYPTGETNSELVVNGIVISSNLVPVTHGNITFEPIFDPTELTGGDQTKLFLGAGNTLYYPSVTASLKAFRAYFSISTGQQTAPRFIVDGNLTDIQVLTDDASEANQQLYDLGGRTVSKKQQSLPKGVYVKEGEKMIIK